MPEIKAAQVTCPVCDSANVDHRIAKRRIGDALTGFMEIDEHVDRCQGCGEDGDFAGVNDDIYKVAIAELSKRAAAKMLGEISALGFSNAHVERVLSLPQRTSARWKKDGASAAAVTLLKFVATFPWMLEVAEKRFDKAHSREILLREAGKVVAASISMLGFERSLSLESILDFAPPLSKEHTSTPVQNNTPPQNNLAANEELALAA